MEYPEQLDQLALQDLLAQVSPDQQEIMVLMDYQELPDLQVLV
jgi:DNA-directed RNA polymerase specialized sigma24 family protein